MKLHPVTSLFFALQLEPHETRPDLESVLQRAIEAPATKADGPWIDYRSGQTERPSGDDRVMGVYFGGMRFNRLARDVSWAEVVRYRRVRPAQVEKAAPPPLGLKPRAIHDTQRRNEILAAIKRYTDAKMDVPAEWVIELGGLL